MVVGASLRSEHSILTVIHMEVPCCSGLTQIAKNAILSAKAELPFEDITVGLDGSICDTAAF